MVASLRFARGYELAPSLVRLRCFPAHTDGVLSVAYIAESDAILSSGLDRLAHVWKMTGELLGTLRQGAKHGDASHGGWQRPTTDLRFSLVFESGLRQSRALDDRKCSGKPQDTCESLELSIVRIGLETVEL